MKYQKSNQKEIPKISKILHQSNLLPNILWKQGYNVENVDCGIKWVYGDYMVLCGYDVHAWCSLVWQCAEGLMECRMVFGCSQTTKWLKWTGMFISFLLFIFFILFWNYFISFWLAFFTKIPFTRRCGAFLELLKYCWTNSLPNLDSNQQWVPGIQKLHCYLCLVMSYVLSFEWQTIISINLLARSLKPSLLIIFNFALDLSPSDALLVYFRSLSGSSSRSHCSSFSRSLSLSSCIFRFSNLWAFTSSVNEWPALVDRSCVQYVRDSGNGSSFESKKTTRRYERNLVPVTQCWEAL